MRARPPACGCVRQFTTIGLERLEAIMARAKMPVPPTRAHARNAEHTQNAQMLAHANAHTRTHARRCRRTRRLGKSEMG